jgi:hypothetical protein
MAELAERRSAKLHYLLRSRKFWATLVVVLIALAGPAAGLGDDAITKITITVAAYILGTALEDGLTNNSLHLAAPRGHHLSPKQARHLDNTNKS